MHYCCFVSASVFLAACVRPGLSPSTNLGLPKSASCRSIRFLTQEGHDGTEKKQTFCTLLSSISRTTEHVKEAEQCGLLQTAAKQLSRKPAASVLACQLPQPSAHFQLGLQIESRSSSRPLGCDYIPVRKIRSFTGDTTSVLALRTNRHQEFCTGAENKCPGNILQARPEDQWLTEWLGSMQELRAHPVI